MSVSARLNRSVVVGGLLLLALVAGVMAWSDREPPRRGPVAMSSTRMPTEALDILTTSTAAGSAIGVSRRLFASSRVTVLADATDVAAQRRAIRAATTLRVPVLLDHPRAGAELERLGAVTVLTFGETRTVPGGRRVTEATAAAQIAAAVGAHTPAEPQSQDVIVVTRSRSANAAAVATATNAGAEVVHVRHADPRRDPRAAAALAARPDAAVIALGTPFVRDFAYTLAVVRAKATQGGGDYLALPGPTYTALYGIPGSSSLGVLGEQGVKASIARVKKLAKKYRAVGARDVVPTFEVIATVAASSAGRDKDYSSEVPVKTLRPLVDAAAKAGVYVILDLQPGRSDFLTQAKRYRSLLRLPHVGLALDPEWRLRANQKHLRQIGSVRVEEVNRVGDWLAALTRKHTLPQKLFVLHQFSSSMIKGRARLDTGHAELATVLHVDGQGTQPAKRGTWKHLHRDAPTGVFWGWKNFVDEDKPMLGVRDTWRKVTPRPELITYQ